MTPLPNNLAQLVDLLSGPAGQHLLVALAHSLWQGAIIAGSLYVALGRLPARNSQARYAWSLAALCGVVFACATTWAVLDYQPEAVSLIETSESKRPPERQAEIAPIRPDISGRAIAVVPDSNPRTAISHATDTNRPRWVPCVMSAWLLGVGCMLLRVLGSILSAHRLAQGPRPVDVRLSLLVDALCLRMGLRRMVRLVDAGTFGPAVFGAWRPAILLPTALLTGVPIESLESILANELAHIRRYDYLVNLVQMFVESALFFNPAVWWISRQIRQEREACCDQWAVAATGGDLTYAQALATWAEHLQAAGDLPATAAVAYGTGNVLDRVKRLLVDDYRPELRVSWSALLSSAACSAVMVVALWRGTQAGVALAAEILSPAERLARLSEERDALRPVVPIEKGKGTISGTITTADGEPLPKEVYGQGHIHNERNTLGTTMLFSTPTFSVNVQSGTAWFSINAEGYAPKLFGPLQIRAGQTIDNLNIVLDRGFVSQLKIVDDVGKPVVGAEPTLYLTKLQ
ncbi:MAG: M56 family metallopeptidase, partial [Singulisphaera sp.]